MTEAEFDKYLASESRSDEGKFDINFARKINFVEKEFGIDIYEDYNYFKFLAKSDYLDYVNKESDKISKKKPKKGRR